MIPLPPSDHTLSPFTGWTRAHAARVADTILTGAARHTSPAGSLIRYSSVPGPLGAEIDALEGFARTFLIAAFRIAGDPEGTTSLAERYAAGFAAGTDPQHPERWLRPDEHPQAKVEAAALALGLHLTRETVWARVSERTRAQTIDYFATCIGAEYWQNNWVWFRLCVEQFLASVGGPFSAADRDEDLALLDSFELGQGWTVDGHGRNFDHYCGWALPFYPIYWAEMVGDDPAQAARIARYRARLDDYLDDALHLIGADGGPLIQGRSLTYRFATAGAAWSAAHHGASRHDPGMLRRAALGQVKHFVERGAPDADGILSIGWHHAWPRIAQNYSGPGSTYWAAKGLAGLALPATHPVWTTTEGALPIDRGSFQRALIAPGWLASGTHEDGVVRIVNHGTDHRLEDEWQPDSPFYAKFGYSTATSPVLAEDGAIDPLDGTLALVRAGRPSHRSGFHVGRVVALASGALTGSSLARAHWPRATALPPNHGVAHLDAPPLLGPLIDAVSVVRGAWEVRFARIRATGDRPEDAVLPGDLVRIGGWALTEPTLRTRAGAWTAGARLASRVVALIGLDDADAGVTALGDATPLAGETHVPWVSAPARVGEWVVLAVGLGKPHAVASPPAVHAAGTGYRIDWPDGVSEEFAPAVAVPGS